MASTPITAVSPNAAPELQPRAIGPEQRAPAPSPAEPSAETQATRLLIQEIEGRYVYTVVDRETGRVLTQLPRQHVQEMGGLESYHAGDMVSTKA